MAHDTMEDFASLLLDPDLRVYYDKLQELYTVVYGQTVDEAATKLRDPLASYN